MNLGGHHRRSVGSAWQVRATNPLPLHPHMLTPTPTLTNPHPQVGFGNIGGVIAVFAFLPNDGPRYIPGYSICIAFVCLSALSCCLYVVACGWQNRRRERSVRDVGLSAFEKMELGDLSPEYRYQL